jgi:hypothetical protein
MFQLLCDSFLQVCGKWENTANLPIWQFFVAPFNMHYDCKVFKLWGVYHMYVERFNTHNKQAQPWTLPWITLLENKSWQSGSRGCSLILCRMYLKWLDKPQKWVPHTKQGKSSYQYMSINTVFEVLSPHSPNLKPFDFYVGHFKSSYLFHYLS